jgi:hypothetical protein
MAKFLWGRSKRRQQFVVSVFLESNDGQYSDHIVVGPMRDYVANIFSDMLDEVVSHDWGEALNRAGFSVSLVIRPVKTPNSALDWLARRMKIVKAEADANNALRLAAQQLDSDGIIADSTPWDRPKRGDDEND